MGEAGKERREWEWSVEERWKCVWLKRLKGMRSSGAGWREEGEDWLGRDRRMAVKERRVDRRRRRRQSQIMDWRVVQLGRQSGERCYNTP
jgi:hypothetical protein